MQVTWKDDLTPMPDQIPAAYEEMCWDMDLIVDRSGEVIATHRTVFGIWYFLVRCDDGQIREVDSRKVVIK